jgi:hypothetical protein
VTIYFAVLSVFAIDWLVGIEKATVSMVVESRSEVE